jgi:hypothetical protein
VRGAAKKMKSENTTIKITRKTKQRLDNLREYKKESYEEVLEKILHILNIFIDKQIKRRQAYNK